MPQISNKIDILLEAGKKRTFVVSAKLPGWCRGGAIESVTFDKLLDEGLCFGWSESMRRKYDQDS